ncbi:MAG TPA: hypothetical protein VFC39_02925 [Acidobacteriaceae bacterium]|nr:hypothetical protein [Acidobacteriaceae bacterium]
MKTALLLFAFLFPHTVSPPSGPALTPNAQYPVHVHLFLAKASGSDGSYHGFGRGDILGASPQGFDYSFSCSEPFLANGVSREFYQGKWKKQDQKLEILMQRIGSDHLDRCDLQVALKPKPYGKYPDTN